MKPAEGNEGVTRRDEPYTHARLRACLVLWESTLRELGIAGLSDSSERQTRLCAWASSDRVPCRGKLFSSQQAVLQCASLETRHGMSGDKHSPMDYWLRVMGK